MSNYTQVLFQRRPGQHDTSTMVRHREIDDDLLSICSVVDITLPRLSREVKKREQLRKVDKAVQVSALKIFWGKGGR